MERKAPPWRPTGLRRGCVGGFSDSFYRDCLKTLELPSRRPYELLKRGAESLFLQGCAAKTHAPDAIERLFRQSHKDYSRKPPIAPVLVVYPSRPGRSGFSLRQAGVMAMVRGCGAGYSYLQLPLSIPVPA
jgi:hypothetical protein